jgi:putative spermidine/putrescine transport system permease protein
MLGNLITFLIFMKEKIPRAIKRNLGYLLILPSVLSIGVMFTGLIYLAYLSFQTYDIFQRFIPVLTLENYYKTVFTSGSQTTFHRTFYLSLLASLASVVLAIPYAYYTIRTSSPLIQKLLIISILIPFFTGDVIKAYGWLAALGRTGMVGWLTEKLLGSAISLINTQTAVFIGLVQLLLPLSVLIVAPSIAAVNRELEMAAENLGATPFQTFIKVVLPLIKPGVLGAFIVSFTIAVTEYAAPDLLGGGINKFVANFIYSIMFNAVNYPYAAAASIFLTLIVSLIVYLILKIWKIGNIFIRGLR